MLTISAVVLFSLGGLADNAGAAIPILAPGEEVTLTSPDGGGRFCRRGTSGGVFEPEDCFAGAFIGTNTDVASGVMRGRVQQGAFILAAGIPYYANGLLYANFSLDGPPGNLVPVQISATADYRNFFVLAGAYLVQSGVTVNVVDRQTGETVASRELVGTSRDGDQGITDVAFANERQVVEGATVGFTVLLRRGGDYRVEMQLEALAQALVVGATEVDARAEWGSVTVRVDEDEIDALEQSEDAIKAAIASHDAAMSSRLAAHDAAISSQVAQHDADIKALLTDLREGQREIIRLLLTPPGRRASDQGDFPLKPERGRRP
jgi:hypothetical protein